MTAAVMFTFLAMRSALCSTICGLLAATGYSAMVTNTSPGPHRVHDGPSFMAFTLNVNGLLEPIAEISVTFTNLFHGHPADIDALLVGPRGQTVMLMSDAGELLSETDSAIDRVNLTFRDGAPLLPANVRIASGTYAPMIMKVSSRKLLSGSNWVRPTAYWPGRNDALDLCRDESKRNMEAFRAGQC